NERARSLDELLVEWSVYHCDFTPSNLIVSHNGTVVRGIDFGKASELAPVSLDLASFIARACDTRTGLVFAGARADDPRLSATIVAMLDEYSPQLSDADRDWIMWCVLYWSVHRIVVYYKTSEATVGWNILRRMNSHLKERKNRHLVQVACGLL
ncbi:MAG: phosphotransferase, partial [Anderseniella sp.]|nr:phosphotransferase [Anderseniella sp.]